MAALGTLAELIAARFVGGAYRVPNENARATGFRAFRTKAVQLVLQAATLGSNGEIYMLDIGDPVKITTLARRLIEMSGLRPGEDIEIRFVGVRPGKKLQEQLWTDSAIVTPTSFPRVLSIQPPPPNEDFERCTSPAIRPHQGIPQLA